MVAAALLAATLCGAQSQDQSVVEAARQKPVRKAKVVITDDDLPSKPEAAPQSAATSPATVPDSAKEAASKQSDQDTTLPGPLEERTGEQAQQLVERLKQEEQALLRRYDEIQRKLADTDNESLRRLYSDSLSRRDETLARKRKEIEEAERALRLASQAGTTQGGTNDAAK